MAVDEVAKLVGGQARAFQISAAARRCGVDRRAGSGQVNPGQRADVM
ncbi:hypothetical protein V6U90_27975 [Micromonospora sp. CPCC 206060]